MKAFALEFSREMRYDADTLSLEQRIIRLLENPASIETLTDTLNERPSDIRHGRATPTQICTF